MFTLIGYSFGGFEVERVSCHSFEEAAEFGHENCIIEKWWDFEIKESKN